MELLCLTNDGVIVLTQNYIFKFQFEVSTIFKLMMMMMMMMMMKNCFCGIVDWRKAISLISSLDHCQRSSPLWISDMPRAGFQPAQNLSSGLVEWSCAVVITTTTTPLDMDQLAWHEHFWSTYGGVDDGSLTLLYLFQ